VVLASALLTGPSPVRAERIFWLDQTLAPRGLDPAVATVRPLDQGTVLVTDDDARGLPPRAIELETPAGSAVYLLRIHDGHDEAALGRDGVTLLRRTDRFALIALDEQHLRSFPAHLGERLVRSPQAQASPWVVAGKRTVDPAVKAALVNAVDADHFLEIVEELSGARSFELDGETLTNNDRNLFRPGQYVAADYLQDRFEALGYTVVRQNFAVSSTPTQNIVAVKPGVTTPDEIVVVGGHYDSIAIDSASGPAPGAEDNGSGTAGVLHMAELFAGYDTDRTLHFVAFGAEEYGLYGSQHYVNEAVANGDDIVAAFNLDMISAYTTRYQIDIEGLSGWPALNDLMDLYETNVATFAPGLATVQKYFSFGSDHVPFQDAGIPCFLAIESDYGAYPGYHRTTDTAEKLTPTLGRDVLKGLAATLADLTDPRTHTDVAVAASGLSAAWVEGGIEVRWHVLDAAQLAGFVVWRGLGETPLAPAFASPIPAVEGAMRWMDHDVDPRPRTYRLEAVARGGDHWLLPETVLTTAPPRAFWLAQNVPNPFNPRTEIAFSIAVAGRVQLDVHDAAGRRVRRLLDAELAAGPHQVAWDGIDEAGEAVASGVYYYRLRHEGSVRTRRMLLVR
jgi:hypothetical protein